MARYEGEKKSGKLGDLIYSSWNGRPYTRRRPETVANPRTEKQQAHRNAFAEISRLSSAMKVAHKVGLHRQALRQKLDTYGLFKKLNKDCYDADGIDYARVRISLGMLAGAVITSVGVDAQGEVSVAFDGHAFSGRRSDQFYLYVFCPDQGEGLFMEPVARDAGFVAASVLEAWRGHDLHLYAFMKSEKGQTSETIYAGQFSCPGEQKP